MGHAASVPVPHAPRPPVLDGRRRPARLGPRSRETAAAPGRRRASEVADAPRRSKEKGLSSERIFEYFDANGDGKITKAEFKTGLYNLDPIRFKLTDTQIDQLVALFDKDGDGEVDMDGACAAPSPPRRSARTLEPLGNDRAPFAPRRVQELLLQHEKPRLEGREAAQITRVGRLREFGRLEGPGRRRRRARRRRGRGARGSRRRGRGAAGDVSFGRPPERAASLARRVMTPRSCAGARTRRPS